jgi:hypothetical protein
MVSVATAGTTMVVVISVHEKQGGDGPVLVHYLHKVGKGEARGEGEKEVDFAIERGLEESVMAANSVGNAAKLLEMDKFGFHWEAIKDCRHSDCGDRVATSPAIHQHIGAGHPGNIGGEEGAVMLEEVSWLEGDAKE